MSWFKRGFLWSALVALILIGTMTQSDTAWADHRYHDSHDYVRPHHGVHDYHPGRHGRGHAYGHYKHRRHYETVHVHGHPHHYFHPVTCAFHAMLHEAHWAFSHH